MIPAKAAGMTKGIRATTPKRCAIYIRVSTAMQKVEGWSLEAQQASLTRFATERGYKVIGVYADEGKSARKRLKDRKEIHRLLEDAKAGLVDVILFKELDRWFRNVSDFYKVQDILDAHGVIWVSERQPGLEMHTKEGRLQVNVLLSVGQNETDSTSDRITYTNKYLRAQKRWTSGAQNLPRGFTLGDDQRVIVDPMQEEGIRYFLEAFKATGSVRAALIDYNETYGERWYYGNAMKLLRNPMLYGAYQEVEDFVGGGAYMTKAEWTEMQSLIRRNASKSQHFYVFSGMVKCADCGHTMVGNATRPRDAVYLYYRCNRRAMEGSCPGTLAISETKLEQELLAMVKEAVDTRIVEVKAVQQARASRPKRKSNREAIERQLDKLEDLYISSDRMTKEKYEAKRAEILAKLVDDDQEPEENPMLLVNLERVQAMFQEGVEAIYAGLAPEERRAFWRGILESVTIRDGKVESVEFLE